MQRTPIEYAPARPHQKQRRIVRRVALGVAVLTAAVFAIRSAPSALARVRLLCWQYRAMHYSAPADRIVYEDDPRKAAKLRAADPSLQIGPNDEAFDFPKPWERFYQLVSPPGRKPAATLFVHGLTNRKGERRLVVIELRSQYSAETERLSLARLEQVVLTPGGFTRDPQQRLVEVFDGIGTALVPYRQNTTWYAGQPDCHDPSHFTIRGTRDGRPSTINGWLRDDDCVEFQVGE